MNIRYLSLALCSLVLASCCSYPTRYSASSSTASAKAVLASPSSGEAYLGASMERFKITPPIKCPPSPEVSMAPVGEPDENKIIHFGAFAVRHGESNDHATVYWWKAQGNPPALRSYHISTPSGEKISFIWINERTIRFQLSESSSKTVRLNEDDGPKVTEL